MAPDRAAAHKPDIRPLAPPLLWPLGAQGLRRPRRARGGPLGRAPTGSPPPPRPRSSPAAPGCASPGIVPRVPGRGRGHFREGRFPASPAPRQGARELAPGPRPPAPAGREEKRVLSGRAPRGSPASSGLSHAGPPGASLSLHLTLGCPPRSPLLALRQFQQAPWALPPRPPPRPPPWSARRGLRALARPLQLAALFSCGLPSTARPPDCPVWSPRASCGC